MFNWICPECGRDVSPSESECRFCAERKKAAEVAVPVVDPAPAYSAPPPPAQPFPQPQAPPPRPEQQYRAEAPLPSYTPPAPTQQTVYPPPPQQPYYPPPPQQMGQPPQPYYPPGAYPQVAYPPQKRGLPTWALALLFALAFIGIIGAVFFGYQYFTRSHGGSASTEPAASARSKPANPLQKYIEVVGIRLLQDAKHHPEARFIVVNHSNAELNDLTVNVTLYASTSRSEEDSVGTFSFKLDTIPGNESKELTKPFNTKLKIYELPDWQNATADVQISQP